MMPQAVVVGNHMSACDIEMLDIPSATGRIWGRWQEIQVPVGCFRVKNFSYGC